MRTEQKIQELDKKIEKKSAILLQNIKSQIDQKYKTLCATTDHMLKKERSELKKKYSKLLKRMAEKMNEQNEMVEKMKRKIEKINEMFRKFEKDALGIKIKEIKGDIEKIIATQNEKYDKVREEQKKIYKNEFGKLQTRGEGLVERNGEKIKSLM
jgi:hypothetical protein